MAASTNYTVTAASTGKLKGNYASKTGPASAAKKAASRRLPKTDGATMTLTVRELGSDKEFSYRATRKALKKPVVRVIKGVKIENKFEIIVKSA